MTDDRKEWVRHGRSFGPVAGAYAQLRPGYPSEVVEFLIGQGRRCVLDLGAGTGKLSEGLLGAGHQVIAVDPAPEMLSELSARHPDVAAVVGAAEAVPLAVGAVDAVVAGQAAHWFDLAVAAPEIDRVLRAGGVVGLVWNLRDERVPWVAALGELLSGDGSHRHSTADEERIVGSLAELLGRRVQRAEFGHLHVLAPEQLVAGLATRSHVVLLEPDERDRLLDAARELFATHPETAGKPVLKHPYRTVAYQLTS